MRRRCRRLKVGLFLFFPLFWTLELTGPLSATDRLKKNYNYQNIAFWNSLRGLRVAIEVRSKLRVAASRMASVEGAARGAGGGQRH